jgi:3D (Asp-Asp-Asp) domain-containing protein
MEPLKQNHKKIFSSKQAKKIIIWLVLVFVFDLVLFSSPSIAQAAINIDQKTAIASNLVEIEQEQLFDLSQEEIDIAIIKEDYKEPVFINNLPKNEAVRVKNSIYRSITAYNSEEGQTDDSPCITANGFDVCKHGEEDTVAANFLPFGTKIRMPAIFGNRVFIVRDRMNSRYYERIDVWMLEKSDALKFGVKIAKIEILE